MPTEFGAGGGGDRGSGGGRWVRGDFPPAIAPYSLDSDASGSDSNLGAMLKPECEYVRKH
eukprot:3231898-Rhodomonas_salina.2